MKISKFVVIGLMFGALLLQACDARNSAAVATSVAATLQISQLETAVAAGQQPEGDESDEGDENGAGSGAGDPAATGTATPSPTSSVPMVSVSVDTNCRRGPRVDYSNVTTILAGEKVEVLKTFPGEDYVVVRNPNGSGDCWLWLRYADQTDFSAYELPVATQPPTPTPSQTPTNTPTPTPVYVWTGTWSMWVGGMAYSANVSQTGNSMSGTFDAGGDTVTLTGSLSANWQEVNGTWTSTGGTNGTFQWQMLANLNQFHGNYNGGVEAWCGARGGAGQPAPCEWP